MNLINPLPDGVGVSFNFQMGIQQKGCYSLALVAEALPGSVVVPLSEGGLATVPGTTLEQPPSQANGGGFNSSMSAGTVTLAAPLNPGNSINLRFLFGVQQEGKYNFCAVIETLPFTHSAVQCYAGSTLPAN